MLYADLIVTNANIETVTQGRAHAMAVRDGKILAVGRTEELLKLAAPKTQIEDLQGKTVLPAFIDAHMHLITAGLRETGFHLDLSECSSLEEALERIRSRIQATEQDRWVIARGWVETRWPERRYLLRQDLDRVAPHHPVVAIRVDGHLLAVNSRALQKLTVTPRPDEFDEAQGLLREETAWALLHQLQPSDEQLQEAVLAAARLAHRLGVTAIHDIVKPAHIRAYAALHQKKRLPLRVYFNPEVKYLESFIEAGLRTGFGDDVLKLGAIKFFADGSIGARNAALYEPYQDADTTGQLNYEQNELNRLVKRAHDHGFQIMIHAIGDRAIDAALEALAHAGASAERRHRIEHAELVTPEQLQRMRELGIIASMQPNFVQWSGPGLYYEPRLGRERDSRICPHREVLAAGVRIAFGSDGMPFGPLHGIHWTVNAPHAAQRLSVTEAIRLYTLGAAYASFEEDVAGSLEPGKRADFIVLSHDPTNNTKTINEIRVERTYLAGEKL